MSRSVDSDDSTVFIETKAGAAVLRDDQARAFETLVDAFAALENAGLAEQCGLKQCVSKCGGLDFNRPQHRLCRPA